MGKQRFILGPEAKAKTNTRIFSNGNWIEWSTIQGLFVILFFCNFKYTRFDVPKLGK